MTLYISHYSFIYHIKATPFHCSLSEGSTYLVKLQTKSLHGITENTPVAIGMEAETTPKLHKLLLLAGMSMEGLRNVWIEKQTDTQIHPALPVFATTSSLVTSNCENV